MKNSALKKSANRSKLRPRQTQSKPTSAMLKPKHFFKRKADVAPRQPIQFPKIFLTFTEKYFLAGLVSFALVLIIIVIGLDLYKDINEKQKIDKERQEIIKDLRFWQSVTNKYKDFRDGYFQLAILEYRLRDFDKAKFYLEKALGIDPNFEKGRELEKVLDTR